MGVIDTDSKKEVFERIDPMQALLAKDHVLLYGHGKVHDEEVLELKRKADSWDSVTNLVPNFTHGMLLIADLVYKTDPLLVETLNLILEQNGVARVEHILHAIYRLGDTFRTEKERHLTGMALRKCFMEASNADVETKATAIQHQWPTCWKWTKTRVDFAHPLLKVDISDLEGFKSQINVDLEYAQVREAATFMVDVMIKDQMSKNL